MSEAAPAAPTPGPNRGDDAVSPWPNSAAPGAHPHKDALVVAAVAVAAFLLAILIGMLPSLGLLFGGATDVAYLPYVLLQLVIDIATQAIPFGLGVYLILALVRPIRSAPTVRAVLLNTVLAAAAGAVLLLVVSMIFAVFQYGGFYGSVFGARFPDFSIDGGNITFVFIDAVGSAALAFVRVAPVVALAGVLQWLWGSRTGHPPQ